MLPADLVCQIPGEFIEVPDFPIRKFNLDLMGKSRESSAVKALKLNGRGSIRQCGAAWI